jgi:hypothetical protein
VSSPVLGLELSLSTDFFIRSPSLSQCRYRKPQGWNVLRKQFPDSALPANIIEYPRATCIPTGHDYLL